MQKSIALSGSATKPFTCEEARVEESEVGEWTCEDEDQAGHVSGLSHTCVSLPPKLTGYDSPASSTRIPLF